MPVESLPPIRKAGPGGDRASHTSGSVHGGASERNSYRAPQVVNAFTLPSDEEIFQLREVSAQFKRRETKRRREDESRKKQTHIHIFPLVLPTRSPPLSPLISTVNISFFPSHTYVHTHIYTHSL